jgi:hypothetical protein
MRRDLRTVRIPNPHHGDISWSLAKEVLRQAGIDVDAALRFLGS